MKFKIWVLGILIMTSGTLFQGCQKNNPDSSNLYIPTENDITTNATLDEMQKGRVLYINNCGECHNYPLPESYTPTEWKSILRKMAPKTSMSSADIDLVLKYVCKGEQ